MTRPTRVIAPIAILALALTGVGIPAAHAADPVDIDVVSVNDFHGRLEAIAPSGGAAVLAGMVNSYRAANPNTAFVGAGDLIGASTFTSFIQKDQPTIDALNLMGLDASAIGNHELDGGRDDLDDRIIPGADWDYLAANLYDRTTGEPAYPEYSVETFDGVTVAFVGAVTDELPSLVSPAGIASLEVRPVVPEVNRVAAHLSDGDDSNGEADVVVLLVHEGAATPTLAAATDDSRFGTIVTGASADIDAIVSGHTHLAYDFDIPIAGTDRTRPVYSSGQYGEKYAHLALSVDPDSGDILSIGATVETLTGFAPDPAVAAIVSDAVAFAAVAGGAKVGDVTADLTRGAQSGGSENRGAESTLGNFVADVQLWATQQLDSQIAFMNPGGLRADLLYAANPSIAGDGPGVVTYSEAAAVQPFANTLVTMTLTTEQVTQVLEQQWQPAGAARPFLKLGISDSLTYTYDPTRAAGDRVLSVLVDGVPIEPGQSFRVTVNSFLASGGDNFGAFVGGTARADSGRIDLQSMVDYFVANPVASPDIAQRAVGVSLSPADADGYSAGDEVTLTLSSLLFSKGGPRAGTVVVSSDGVELGSAPIDPAIVDTNDEVGRATVTITLPATTTAGTLPVTVTVPESGTTVTLSLTTTLVAQPITSVTAPAISGTAQVGRTLTASGGAWSVANPSLAFQWLRDGVEIPGATANRYRLTVADAGAAITVRVTASAPDTVPGEATSAARTVAKLDSTAIAAASRIFVRAGTPVTVNALVRAPFGVIPTGSVAVFDGRTQVGEGTVGAGGRVSLTVPGLERGIHLLTLRYLGSAQVTATTSNPFIVIAW
jgi:5'-nucleotidase